MRRGTIFTVMTALAITCVGAAAAPSDANACGTCEKDKKWEGSSSSGKHDWRQHGKWKSWNRSYPVYEYNSYSAGYGSTCGGGSACDGWTKMATSLARSCQESARGITFDLPRGEYRWRAESHAAYVQYISIRGSGGNSADAVGNSQGPISNGRLDTPGVGPVIGEGVLRGPDRLSVSISHSSRPYGSRTSNLWLSPNLSDALFQARSSESFCFRTEDMVNEQGGAVTLAPDSDADFDDAILCIERLR